MRPALKMSLVAGGVLAILAVVAVLKLRPRPGTGPVAERTSPVKAAGTKSNSGSAAPLRVTAVTLAATPLVEKISATGTLRAEEGVELQPETNGKIVAINFTEGAKVRRGDLLLKLNDTELRATLQRALFRRELAELKGRRMVQLMATKSVNQQDYDAAFNELSVQQAEVALVEAQLGKLEIRAPFDGVVGLRFVSEGAFVTPTIRVATLQRLEQLKIDFSVPEKYAPRIQPGRPVKFTVDGGGRVFHGEVYAIDPRIDSATRTVLIRALCPNPEGRLLPGAFANVEFTLAEVADALLVPAAAVIPGLSEKNVFVVRDGKAVRCAVQTGVRTESSVQIISGLAVGDVVVTSGQQQLRAGQAVRVDSAGENVAGATSKRPGKKADGAQ